MNRTSEPYERLGNSSATEEGISSTPQHPQPALPQHATMLAVSSEAKSRERYRNKLYGLGVAECVLGGLCIVLAISSLALEIARSGNYVHLWNLFTYTSQGIWDGVFIVGTGILGICAGKNPTLVLFNANMALSIITAVFSSAAIVLSGFASAFPGGYISSLVIHVAVSLLLLASFIITIVHSGYCCAGVCGKNYNPGRVIYISQAPQPQQVVVGVPNMQYSVAAGMVPPPQINLAEIQQ